MLFAVLGGIHGDVSTLNSALACVDSEGIQTVFCTGNLVAGGEAPNEVIAALRARRAVCVQGNEDRMVVRAVRKAASMRERLDEARFESIARAHDLLGSENIEFLRGLPRVVTRDLEGISVCLCHGTVTSQRDTLRHDLPEDWFRRQREAANTDIVICGSDDQAFVKRLDVTLFINPGTLVGEKAFALVNTESDPPTAKMIRL